MTEGGNDTISQPPAALVAVAGWAIPGMGYVLMGEKARGLTIMITVMTLYVFGLLIAGVRVIDVPGYDKSGLEDRVDSQGRRVELGGQMYADGKWALRSSSSFLTEVAAKPWYVGQILAGPVNLIASASSLHAARENIPMSHARLAEIGTLYTAVAGMLNLLAIIDSASRAAHGDTWDDADDDADDDAGEPELSNSSEQPTAESRS